MLFICLCLLFLLALAPAGYAQEADVTVEEVGVHFPQGSYVLIPSFSGNNQQLTAFTGRLEKLMSDTTVVLEGITIRTGASPEGGVKENYTLSLNRAIAIKDYLRRVLPLPDSAFVLDPIGEDWDGLCGILKRYDIPSCDTVTAIVEECRGEDGKLSDEACDLCETRIKRLDDSRTWRYLLENVFPELRSGDNKVSCLFKPRHEKPATVLYIGYPPPYGTVPPSGAYPPQYADTSRGGAVPPVQAGSAEDGKSVSDDNPEDDISETKARKERKRYHFAVKTNLLFDLIAAANVEVEFPVGKHISIMGEHWFPWYLVNIGGKQCAYEVLFDSVEGRWWFSGHQKKYLGGWFAGLYAGCGKFDLEYDSRGWQCRFFYGAGVSGGYSLPIGKQLRLEMSLSAGYMSAPYQYYEQQPDWGLLIWKNDGILSWFGPTKAKVSLSWIIPRFEKKAKKREVK